VKTGSEADLIGLESNCSGGKYPDPGKRKFYGHRIGTKNHAQKGRKNADEKGKILIIDILSFHCPKKLVKEEDLL
jgi:hypothetical protein